MCRLALLVDRGRVLQLEESMRSFSGMTRCFGTCDTLNAAICCSLDIASGEYRTTVRIG